MVNQEKVDRCDVEVCHLNDVINWWNDAFKDLPSRSYLNAARQEEYESILEIIEQCFSTEIKT